MRRAPKLCLVANPDSIHVQRWANHLAGRGFDVTMVSFYQPELQLSGNPGLRYVRPRRGGGAAARRSPAALNRLPGLRRLLTAVRYKRGGFYGVIEQLDPDLVHGHYVSDYGFLTALAGRHPTVVSAWGSDLLLDPAGSILTRQLVRWTLRQADLVTYDAADVEAAARRLGARREALIEIVLGVDGAFLDALKGSAQAPADRGPIIASLRSLERGLYNVELLIRAMPAVLLEVPKARLVVGNDGALRGELEALAAQLGVAASVDFVGVLKGRTAMADCLGKAAVYASVPASDGTSVTLLEAMAAGAYPVVSDLPANRQWVSADGGAVVQLGDGDALARALVRGLTDPVLRDKAAELNREVVHLKGLWETNMARMETAYRDLLEARPRVATAG